MYLVLNEKSFVYVAFKLGLGKKEGGAANAGKKTETSKQKTSQLHVPHPTHVSFSPVIACRR